MSEKTDEKRTEINVKDYVSAKRKNSNNFVIGTVTGVDANSLTVKTRNEEVLLNKEEVDVYKMGYGQRFDKRELPEAYQVTNSEGKQVPLTQIDYKDLKLLLNGKKTEGIYTLSSANKDTGEVKEYDVRLQLARTDAGKMQISPSFKNKNKIDYGKYNLDEEQQRAIEKGEVVKSELANKTGEKFTAYLKKDPALNNVDYLTESRFNKQIELMKNKELKEKVQGLSDENKLKFLAGDLKITAGTKNLTYDFRNVNVAQSSLKAEQNKTKKTIQKQTQTQKKSGPKM